MASRLMRAGCVEKAPCVELFETLALHVRLAGFRICTTCIQCWTVLSKPLKASRTFLDATFSFKKHPRSLRVLHTLNHNHMIPRSSRSSSFPFEAVDYSPSPCGSRSTSASSTTSSPGSRLPVRHTCSTLSALAASPSARLRSQTSAPWCAGRKPLATKNCRPASSALLSWTLALGWLLLPPPLPSCKSFFFGLERIVHQGPHGVVYQERARRTLHWEQLGVPPGAATQGTTSCTGAVRCAEDGTQSTAQEAEHTELKWSETWPAGLGAHESRPQPAILARGNTPAGVRLAQDGIGTRGPH